MNVSARNFLARLAARREARLLALLILLLGVFVFLLFAIRGEWLPGLDLRITRYLQRDRDRPMDAAAVFLTNAGGAVPLGFCGVAATVWFWRTHRPRTAVLVLLAALVGHPLDLAIKLLAARPRPDANTVEVLLRASGTSFPSGHALANLLFWGLLAALCLIYPGRKAIKATLAFLFVLVALLIGLSRIYVGGHWASDVLGGWVCGLALLVGFLEARRIWAAEELLPLQNATVSSRPLYSKGVGTSKQKGNKG